MLQLDFLPVGEETASGDAILVQFREGGMDRTVVVDGGRTETADQILAHLNSYYGGTNIDLVVCTHPDDDHIRGLFGVVERANWIGELWVHQPSSHGYAGSSEHKAPLVDELVKAARARGAVIREPFVGMQFTGAVTVAGPSREDYEFWLGQEATVDTKVMIAKHAARSTLVAAMKARYGSALLSDPGETLDPGEGTTPRNQHSVILNIEVDGIRALLTDDAGVPALNAAADRLEAWGMSRSYPHVFQVPHHGSRRNLDPAVLDRLLGSIGTFADGGVHDAIASVAKKALDHPRGAIANAVTRRGFRIFATRGNALCCNFGYPQRWGWSEAAFLGWLDEDL